MIGWFHLCFLHDALHLVFQYKRFTTLVGELQSNCYRAPTKLQEDNVFSRVSVHRGEGVCMWPLPRVHWTSLYRFPLHTWPPRPQPPLESDLGPPALAPIWTSDLDPLLKTSGGHHLGILLEWLLVVATGARTVCKRAVRILLECFLVFWNEYFIIEFWYYNYDMIILKL